MIKFSKNIRAFSLVEISIVILIIGLLVAGISKATDMIFDAEVKSARSITKGTKVNRMNDLSLWLETSLTESIDNNLRSDNTTITLWKDINPQSTNKYFFRPTGTPQFVTNGYNNLPAVKFVATTDAYLPYMNDGTTVATFNSNQIFGGGAYGTIFAVVKPVASAEIFNFCDYTTSFACAAGKEIKLSIDATGKVAFAFPDSLTTTATITSSSAVTSQNAIIVSAVKNAGGNRLFVDGANAQTTAVANTNTVMTPFTGTFRIGSGSANSNVYEIIVFSSNLTDDDRWIIESYLGKKYGITVARTAVTP